MWREFIRFIRQPGTRQELSWRQGEGGGGDGQEGGWREASPPLSTWHGASSWVALVFLPHLHSALSLSAPLGPLPLFFTFLVHFFLSPRQAG